ncbi:MAG: hypothetical protein KJ876_15095 [Alphaproteobacteria bacterium]|uniref:DUF6356 family protein n=1 Tax=Sphingobium sp. TaxID=1912891 RepID=UPI000C5957A4|nr:DUF6356 family protein [Sphingobium sp.]MBU0659083.1 hypothetical protein [Alphaproteobacteria bacterium]MBJ7442785.1 hypothetical protein [Sphingobium sp.]MBS89346.1 hypothetical protein [Sphingobium sp.]MBU0774798.1 hypothetical protein [Alphaproteobacteria bacterium]MBU0869417.1 hypothetical protein [Alphaproteobacteria bacterium]|tara:strand:+ start:10353 stop:10607 length:255 start_codon:yes stop_codon:yes gene_type:complete
MIDRYFRDHPRSVGETYFQHLQTAGGFGGRMMLAGTACLVHALLPCLFVKTGSRAIQGLHDDMVNNRKRVAKDLSCGHQAVAEK